MKTCQLIPLLVMGLLPKTFAATLAVLPGGSIQEKVDLAQPGDIVAISGGTYAGDVTVNKAIRLVEMDGHEVTITGNVTFAGVTNPPPFEGFAVGSPGKGITVNNTTGIVLKNIDARAGFGVIVSAASKAEITGGFYSKIKQDGGELTVCIAQVTGNFETTANSLKTVAMRVTAGGDAPWNSKKSWFGYSSAGQFSFDGTASDVVLVGAKIDVNNRGTDGLRLQGSNNRFQVYNCSIINVKWGNNLSFNGMGWSGANYPGRGIFLDGAGNRNWIINNFVSLNYFGLYYENNNSGDGIRTSQASTTAHNNIVLGARYAFFAPFGADFGNNFWSAYWASESGGVVPSNSQTGDPKFTATPPELQPSSPCINAGIIAPVFNDLDGTRNDIGPGG